MQREAMAMRMNPEMARQMAYMAHMRPMTKAAPKKTPLSKRFFNAIFTKEGATLHDPYFD